MGCGVLPAGAFQHACCACVSLYTLQHVPDSAYVGNCGGACAGACAEVCPARQSGSRSCTANSPLSCGIYCTWILRLWPQQTVQDAAASHHMMLCGGIVHWVLQEHCVSFGVRLRRPQHGLTQLPASVSCTSDIAAAVSISLLLIEADQSCCSSWRARCIIAAVLGVRQQPIVDMPCRSLLAALHLGCFTRFALGYTY